MVTILLHIHGPNDVQRIWRKYVECTYQYSVDLTRIDGYAIVSREIVINGTFYKSSLEIALVLLLLPRKLQKDGMSVEWI